ncbi:hypothetical protein EDD11_004481 [Mortierella claussenii]|nr:hypothetical protein EDD11_004481 [Mortierella claussenii]
MPIPLLILVLSHIYMIKPRPDDDLLLDRANNASYNVGEFEILREPFWVPGMPLFNNMAQLLEWITTCVNGIRDLWKDWTSV